jgi:hypothetical protein
MDLMDGGNHVFWAVGGQLFMAGAWVLIIYGWGVGVNYLWLGCYLWLVSGQGGMSSQASTTSWNVRERLTNPNGPDETLSKVLEEGGSTHPAIYVWGVGRGACLRWRRRLRRASAPRRRSSSCTTARCTCTRCVVRCEMYWTILFPLTCTPISVNGEV